MDPVDVILATNFLMDVGKWAADELKERWTTARKDYRAKPLEELTTEFEVKRRRLLNELSALQTRIILEVKDKTLLQKLLPVLIEHMLDVYEANVEQDLDLLQTRIRQIEGFLDRDKKDRDERNRIRRRAVVIAVIAFIILFGGAIVGSYFGLTTDYVIPILAIPLPIIMWSAIGSFTSLLYRFNKSDEAELRNPMRWLVTRPIIGIVMGIIAYLVVVTGLLASASQLAADTISTNQLMWLVAFLAGFSDVFAEGILRSLIGRLGGDKSSALISQENGSGDGISSKSIYGELIPFWSDKISLGGKRSRDQPEDKDIPDNINAKASPMEMGEAQSTTEPQETPSHQPNDTKKQDDNSNTEPSQ